MKKFLFVVVLILIPILFTACYWPLPNANTAESISATTPVETVDSTETVDPTEVTPSSAESISATTPVETVDSTETVDPTEVTPSSPEFPEVDPYSEDCVKAYTEYVRSREYNSFPSQEEIDLLNEAGFDVHGKMIYRYSNSYLEPLQFRAYPVILSYHGSLLLWSVASDGRLFIEDLAGLEKDQPSHGLYDENPFGFYGNAHYSGNDQIIDADEWIAYSYDTQTGLLSIWRLGFCLRTFQAAPAGAEFFGYSEGSPGGCLFQFQDKVYRSWLSGSNYDFIAENVKNILSLDFKFNEIWDKQTLFLMNDGSLKACIPYFPDDGGISYQLVNIQ